MTNDEDEGDDDKVDSTHITTEYAAIVKIQTD